MYRFAGPFVLAAGVLLAPAVLPHPDLLAQIERLDEQLQAAPDNPELLIRRGDLYRRHEDFTAAARDFGAARMLAPGHPELDFYQGRLALEGGDDTAAATFLDRYLESHPQHAVGWRLRGEAALALSDASAPACFESAIRFSDAPSPELFRQWVLALLTAGDTTGALEAVDLGLARLGVEVTLLGIGADVALMKRNGGLAGHYLKLLPAGLERLAPWSDRFQSVDCLAGRTGGGMGDVTECTVHVARRLEAQLRQTR